MSEENQIPDPPVPNGVVTGGVDMETAGMNHMFAALSNLPTENAVAASITDQRTEADLARLEEETKARLTSLAQNNLNLVHSASNVFKELRYYDAVRLRMYAHEVYKQLLKIIGETPTVPMEVKANLPDFNFLSFPLMIDPNHLTTEIVVSIYHREPVIEVVFDLIFKTGKVASYSNRFKYKAN